MTEITEVDVGWEKTKKNMEISVGHLAERVGATTECFDKKLNEIKGEIKTIDVTDMDNDGWRKIARCETITKTVDEKPVSNVTIRGNGGGSMYEVFIDGNKINNCRSADFHVDVDGIPTVKLELVCVKGVTIEGGEANLKNELTEIETKAESEEDFGEVLDSVRKFKESLNVKEE